MERPLIVTIIVVLVIVYVRDSYWGQPPPKVAKNPGASVESPTPPKQQHKSTIQTPLSQKARTLDDIEVFGEAEDEFADVPSLEDEDGVNAAGTFPKSSSNIPNDIDDEFGTEDEFDAGSSGNEPFSNRVAPQVIVKYCPQSNMKKNFEEMQQFLEYRYPQLVGSIHGQNYPLPFHIKVISKIGSSLHLLSLVFLMGGSFVFQKMGIPEPSWLDWAKNNRMQVFIGIFGINYVTSNMAKTGAFEVFLDDDLIFSKLEMNKFPSVQDLQVGLAQFGLRPTAQ
uniref:Selenoprotein T n=1 Tax=Fibrocapsa japonica TaxID=94617 RepID=A0A7S2V5G7_9STRA|eukprot:CAMPEP_0113944066 /NCGR_PEP_ID=MMETSP1339-20121228/30617_1 /TAXON_ID=94617 /ORGANISM="Fibrocapsa japonica" /LENGTH=280 /DNA_ID=CAMNT_0000949131 /DNA_START=57 /DNA_END=899 /DNA_ORIENTATION=- /assembly_acc=CAM_ASM_000762